MKKRIAFIALALGGLVSSAGLRGCQDPTKPIPWVSVSDVHDGLPAPAVR